MASMELLVICFSYCVSSFVNIPVRPQYGFNCYCSGIGLLMFLIFINELTEALDRVGLTVKLFVDNIMVYITMTLTNYPMP